MCRRSTWAITLLVAVLSMLAFIPTADAQVVCFSAGNHQVVLEVAAFGGSSFILGGDWIFPNGITKRIIGSARLLAPNGPARFGIGVPNGRETVLLDGVLNPPLYNDGSGQVVTDIDPVTTTPVQFQGIPCPAVP